VRPHTFFHLESLPTPRRSGLHCRRRIPDAARSRTGSGFLRRTPAAVPRQHRCLPAGWRRRRPTHGARGHGATSGAFGTARRQGADPAALSASERPIVDRMLYAHGSGRALPRPVAPPPALLFSRQGHPRARAPRRARAACVSSPLPLSRRRSRPPVPGVGRAETSSRHLYRSPSFHAACR